MKTGIFDLETSSLNADFGILLCCSYKEYGKPGVTTIRADDFPSWRKERSDNKAVVAATLEALDQFDILAAHNGQWFDKRWLNTVAIYHGLKPIARWKKLVDPVLVARRHLKMGRNSLAALVDYLEVSDKKTPLNFRDWLRASLDGNVECMNRIVKHCIQDVKALEGVYDRIRPLVEKIDSRGSGF